MNAPARAPLSDRVQECFQQALGAIAEDMADGLESPAQAQTGASPAAAGDADRAAAVHPRIWQAVEDGKPHHVAPQEDFGRQLATLSARLDDRHGELTHAQARSLLEAAGVTGIDAAHRGSAADAAIQALLVELIRQPLRAAARCLPMIPDVTAELAIGGTRVAAQGARGAAGVLVRQARQAVGRFAHFGRSVPPDVLKHLCKDQEAQLKRLVDDLALLGQHASAPAKGTAPGVDLQAPATQEALIRHIAECLQLHDGIDESAEAVIRHNQAVRQAACVKPKTRARVAMAFATLAVDVLSRTGANLALAGTDVEQLAQLTSLVTYPAMAALTKAVDNWYETRAIAGQMLLEHAQVVRQGKPVSEAQLLAWSRWAQDHFQSAAQANHHRRDEHVFQPALQQLQHRIDACGYSLGRQRQLAAASGMGHYRSIKAQHRIEDEINRIDQGFAAGRLDTHQRGMELLLLYARIDDALLSRDQFKLLVCNDAQVLLQAQLRRPHDPRLAQLLDDFRAAFVEKCGQPLHDDDLMRLYKLRLVRGAIGRAADLPAALRPDAPRTPMPRLDKLGFFQRRVLNGERGQLKRRHRHVHALEAARQTVARLAERPADATADATGDEADDRAGDSPVALSPELASRLAKVQRRIASLESEQQATRDAHARDSQDVAHYRSGEAQHIDPDGWVARTILDHRHGVRDELRRRLQWDHLRKEFRHHLGQSVVLPAALTAAGEAGRYGVRELVAAVRDAVPDATLPPATDTPPDITPGTTPAAPPGTTDGLPRAVRLRRAVVNTPAPPSHWKAADAGLATRIESVRLLLYSGEDEAAPDEHTADTVDLRLQQPGTYLDWLRALRREHAQSGTRLNALASQHERVAAQLPGKWSDLQAARSQYLSAAVPGGNSVPKVVRQAWENTYRQRLGEWNALVAHSQRYLRALRLHQRLTGRLEDPEQSYLASARPSASLETERQTLRPVIELRGRLGGLDMIDACVRLVQLPQPARAAALAMLLDKASDSGRVELMRHLDLLPEQLRTQAGTHLLQRLGDATPDEACAAAFAALPQAQRATLDRQLSPAQREAIDRLAAASPGCPRPGTAANAVLECISGLHRTFEEFRDKVLVLNLQKMGRQADFGFGQDNGEPVKLLVKVINSRPVASRSELALELIKACTGPAQHLDAAALRSLRAQLQALVGVEQDALWPALTASIRQLPDCGQRLIAFDEALRELCIRRPVGSAYDTPPRSHLDTSQATVPAFTRGRAAESFKALLELLPQLPAQDRLDRMRQIAPWTLVRHTPPDGDALADWTSLCGRIGVDDGPRAELLEWAIRMAALHYQQAHIGNTLRSSRVFLGRIPAALAGMSDGAAQLRVLATLTGQFKLRVNDGTLDTQENFQANDEVTRAHFDQVAACLGNIRPGSQVQAVELLARAIRTGAFDTAGRIDHGTPIRLQHFKSLAASVNLLPAAQRRDAMQRLLAQAFAETRTDMQFPGQAFRRWEPGSTFDALVENLTSNPRNGLTVHQESELLFHLAAGRWNHEWRDPDSPVGGLMSRLQADLKERAEEQAGIDRRDEMIHHLIDCLTSAFSDFGGPRGRLAKAGRPGKSAVAASIDGDGPIHGPPPARIGGQASDAPPRVGTGARPASDDPPAASRPAASRPAARGGQADMPDMPSSPAPARTLSAEQIAELSHYVDIANALSPNEFGAHQVSLDTLVRRAQAEVPHEIYRVMRGDGATIQDQGLKHAPSDRIYPPSVSEADCRLADIIVHTASRGGSAGAAMSFSEDRAVTNRFLHDGEVNLRVTVQTRPDMNADADAANFSGYRNIADILATDGVRLARQKVIQPTTLAKALRYIGEFDELEVFNVHGRIHPTAMTDIEQVDLRSLADKLNHPLTPLPARGQTGREGPAAPPKAQ